jgi:hypothetical protein
MRCSVEAECIKVSNTNLSRGLCFGVAHGALGNVGPRCRGVTNIAKVLCHSHATTEALLRTVVQMSIKCTKDHVTTSGCRASARTTMRHVKLGAALTQKRSMCLQRVTYKHTSSSFVHGRITCKSVNKSESHDMHTHLGRASLGGCYCNHQIVLPVSSQCMCLRQRLGYTTPMRMA